MDPSQPQDKLTGHEYDGIQEYDNPTPGWWTWLFTLTVVFSFCYMVYYHLGTVGVTIHEHHAMAVETNKQLKLAGIGDLEPDNQTVARLMGEPDMLEFGKDIYKSALCESCHGADGQGLVGPNLTDNYYNNVKELTDLITVIADGAGNGAMPAWKTRLSQEEIILVSAYVASLRGQDLKSNYPNDPYGQKIPPFETTPEQQ